MYCCYFNTLVTASQPQQNMKVHVSSCVFVLVKYEQYTSAVFMWHFEFIALEMYFS